MFDYMVKKKRRILTQFWFCSGVTLLASAFIVSFFFNIDRVIIWNVGSCRYYIRFLSKPSFNIFLNVNNKIVTEIAIFMSQICQHDNFTWSVLHFRMWIKTAKYFMEADGNNIEMFISYENFCSYVYSKSNSTIFISF